ncbi:unnamed protein product [Fraxinus pennsylvanica]|uniref:Uncharacterized protein n=1 Tax=Fraxinus pennsylvanica TaxID=56036 RepID=A0AAD1YXK4_9LAMI|nr:unnamed protein product [Fraxinus pennsylvanica]
MAYIQSISILLILFAGFSCLPIPLTKARQFKLLNKQEKHDIPASLPTNASPHVLEQKRIPPPTNEKHEIDSSDAKNVPTEPGNSPRTGHSFPSRKENVQGKIDDFRHTESGPSPGFSCLPIPLTKARQFKLLNKQEKHDFPASLPTKASPHVLGQKRIPPPTNEKHEIDSSDAENVPTEPGNSPRTGHSFPSRKENVQGKIDDFKHTESGPSPGIGH